MKDFDYYSTVNVPYPDKSEYTARRKSEINDAPMTANQRREALEGLKQESQDWFKRESYPYYARRNALEAEFWRDARDDLGYERILGETAVGVLEAEAWERGHANGFSEVYGCLCSLAEFAEKMIQGRRDAERPALTKGEGR